MAGTEDIRSEDGWSAADVAFAGEVKEETTTGDVTLEGHDGDEPIPSELVVKYQPYGFDSRMPAGTEVLLLETQGEDLALVGANVDRSGSLSEGQSKMYDSAGNYVTCTTNGVEVYAMTGKTIDLKSSTHLGAGTDFMLMGSTFSTAFSSFISSWLGAVTTWKGSATGPELVYATALEGFLTTLKNTVSTWLSTAHKLD